ncbi:MAG: hypothetical protein PUK77_01155 [bacterium]|nr:hypothetical protein [bacterium]
MESFFKKKMKKTEKGFESPDFNVIVSGDSYFCFMNPGRDFPAPEAKGEMVEWMNM